MMKDLKELGIATRTDAILASFGINAGQVPNGVLAYWLDGIPAIRDIAIREVRRRVALEA